MRRMIAIGIMTCFLLSLVPAISQSDSFVEIYDEVVIDDKMIDESELTLPQLDALNAVGMGRGSNTDWSAAGGSQSNDEIYEMIFDSQGNVIVCGTIYQASYFGSIEVYTEGEGDILIAKLSTTGTWEWAVSAGTALYYDECRGVTIDSNDNVYGTGYFQGSVSFGDTTVETTGFDGWIARVNSTGDFDWAMKFGGFDVDVGWDIAADNYDNLYVTGYYQNETEFAGTVLNSGNNENSRFFVAYFNTSSEFWEWADDTTGTGNNVPYQVVVDPVTNDAYIAGYNTGIEVWGDSNFTSSPQSTYAGYVVKYSDTGAFIWGQNTGGNQCFGTCGVYFNNIVIHPDGGIVVGGNFLNTYKKQGGSIVNGQGDWDVLIIRYDSNGTQLWTYHAGGLEDDRLQSLSVNAKGQVQFGGRHFDDMKFDSTTLLKNTTTNKFDAFIAQVANDSDFQWAISFGGADNDTAGALLSMPDGSIIAGGDFSGTVWFGSTPRTATDQDIFVWKFEHDKDNDGITDYSDNCLNTPNSNQSNFDLDLKGDACDSDDDNDGLHDVLDDCRYGVTEWNQSNTTLDHDADGCIDVEEDNDDDNDGVLDIDDNCPSGVLDWVVDSTSDLDGDGCRDLDEDFDDDGDGVLDEDDNCQYEANPNQDDFENDDIGDVCDADDDGDGIDDLVDDCAQGALNWTSAIQTDKDNDGCEDEGSNEDPDDDNDGILDGLDQCPRGEVGWNSSQSNDRDGDGCRNDNEDNDNDNDTVINEVDLCANGITNWRKNTTNDNDGDGCLDDREDSDDDNDGFSDLVDFCPLQEGTASQGGMKGCPDFDSDGWADSADAFFQDETQWNDGDGDGFGDNPSGNTPDACPFFFGNSSIDRIGCIDTDGDGYSDPDLSWATGQGADAFIDEPSQWSDVDGDGYGDNFDGEMVDFCTNKEGTSTIDRFGCPDIDGDGYSDPDAFWGIDKWEALGFGPDAFSLDPTQWFDTDGDGFGDNWGNPEWNDSRDENWPGVFVENATSADMCPLVSPDGSFDDEIYYPGCLLTEPSDGGESKGDENVAGDSEGMSTTTIIGIVGGIVVLGLISVIFVMVNKKSGPKKKRTGPKDLNDLPVLSEPNLETSSPDSDTIGSWEELPAGDYLDPDENGTVWFKANDGDNWYQNGDGTWTKWQD
tara:strand:+ start:43 stop:3510 length:3468 start_codon:yes stop_codon:yes gene_type:complete